MTPHTALSSRPYADADLPRVVAFLQATGGPERGYDHVGDFLWRLYQNTVFDPARDIRLWDDEHGGLLAIAWFEEPDGVTMDVHPSFQGSGVLEGPILEWAASHPARLDGVGELWTWGWERGDDRLVAYLATRGFARDPFHMLAMRRDLSAPIPDAPLPHGWSVRAVGGEEEWAERVEIHREVWHPSRVTLAAYRRLREAPGYAPDLDLVAAAPDDAFGAYCICWYDPVNRTGEFEPVGTRPAHRRKGLGRAVILEGLRRLRDRGAETAYVYSVHTSDASTRLYESAGFEVFNRAYLYGRK